jgi:hypothetical protein
VQALGGAAEVARLGDGEEGAGEVDVHGRRGGIASNNIAFKSQSNSFYFVTALADHGGERSGRNTNAAAALG